MVVLDVQNQSEFHHPIHIKITQLIRSHIVYASKFNILSKNKSIKIFFKLVELFFSFIVSLKMLTMNTFQWYWQCK